MTKTDLEKALNEALENYKADVQSSFDEYSKNPATIGDIADLAKQTFYALDSFKTTLIKYLD